MLCRGAAPLARYRWIDTDEANVAIRVPKKLVRRIKCFGDRGGGLHGGLPGKTGRRRQFLPGRGPPILSMRKMFQRAPHAPRRGTTKRLEGTALLKNEQHVHLPEGLTFMARRESRVSYLSAYDVARETQRLVESAGRRAVWIPEVRLSTRPRSTPTPRKQAAYPAQPLQSPGGKAHPLIVNDHSVRAVGIHRQTRRPLTDRLVGRRKSAAKPSGSAAGQVPDRPEARRREPPSR
jgi:hypothetical protein